MNDIVHLNNHAVDLLKDGREDIRAISILYRSLCQLRKRFRELKENEKNLTVARTDACDRFSRRPVKRSFSSVSEGDDDDHHDGNSTPCKRTRLDNTREENASVVSVPIHMEAQAQQQQAEQPQQQQQLQQQQQHQSQQQQQQGPQQRQVQIDVASSSSLSSDSEPYSDLDSAGSESTSVPESESEPASDSESDSSTPESSGPLDMKTDGKSAENLFSFYKHAFIIPNKNSSTSSSSPATNDDTESNANAKTELIRTYIVLLYNIGLAFHKLGVIGNTRKQLMKALEFYELAMSIVAIEWTTVDSNDMLLLLALSNNLGHIHSHLLNFHETKKCLIWLRELMKASKSCVRSSNNNNNESEDSHDCRRGGSISERDYSFFFTNVLIFEEKLDLSCAPTA